MITKTIIKDYVLKKCPYLALMELNDNTLIDLLKKAIDNKTIYKELLLEDNEFSKNSDENDGFNLNEVLKDYPHLKSKIKEYENQTVKNEVEELIEKYSDNQLISRLSRTYFEEKYGKENCKRCDVDDLGNEIYNQKTIQEQTDKFLNDSSVKIIFEGQIVFNNCRARFDVLIRNDDNSFDIIEVKGVNDVFEHPTKNKIKAEHIDSKIKQKYLYDLLFQYYVYKNAKLNINNVGYMFINKEFELSIPSYPIALNDFDSFFVIKNNINLENGTISLKDYFDKKLYVFKINKPSEIENESIESILEQINLISNQKNLLPKRNYLCRKNPRCPFIEFCFNDANEPNSIFKLTNWNAFGGNYNTTMKLIDEGIYNISDIPEGKFSEFNDKNKRLNVYHQIRYQKKEIKEKYIVDFKKVEEILKKDYLNDDIKWLIFFDFESFQNCMPLVDDSKPWKQVVSQYSMHVVNVNYDLSKHDFDSGVGGQIYHYEFIGNPETDKFKNPSIDLYSTLLSQLNQVGINPLGKDYKVIVFNKNFEESRMKEFIKHDKFSKNTLLVEFVENFKNNIVDLLDFFTSGAIYSRDFNGRGSLKVVQPTLAEDKDVLDYYKNILEFDLSNSLDYHKENALVYNGAICLDLYKSLLIRSHLNEENINLPTKELLNQALAYCKIDSWGTVIIFDIIKNIYNGTLKLDIKKV